MKPFSRILIVICCLLCGLPAAMAKPTSNGLISGYITNMSGSPLGDAIIRIFREVQQGEKLSVIRSNSRGFFESANLRPGTYYLQVSRQGYQPVTTTKFKIDSGRTISLDIILQDFVEYITNDEDPRNWDLKTVMRSTSDRRHIFRDIPVNNATESDDSGTPFYRSGAMSIASRTSFSDEGYVVRPQTSRSGIFSNFAFTEPVSQHGRMILSGQLDFSYGSFWRVRDTYNYRPDGDHDYKVSVGYGRMNVDYPDSSSIPSQLLSQEPDLRQSVVQTLAFGVEGTTGFLDLLTVKYGFDYSRLHYGVAKSLFYPSIQILLAPSEGWVFQTSLTSRHLSDTNTIVLPDGEILNLAEPTLITAIGNRISMSQVRHSEVSAQRSVNPDTDVEVAVYQDRTQGPGLPLLVTTIAPSEKRARVIEMNEDHSSQRGIRVTVKRRIMDCLSGSVAYAYGDARSISVSAETMSSDYLEENLASYLRQRYQHSVTGQLGATIPASKTKVLATVRWYSGNPLTPVDWFSDRMDIGTKSTNFEIRQAIPLPEFFGATGRWEVLVDLRNILNQGKEVLPATDGEIVLNRNPRSLRFGLSLNFR